MNWLFFGFLAAWIIHLAYLLSMTMRQSSIRREMESLRRMVEERTRG